MLGWFDIEKGAIEGITQSGNSDTIPIDRIQRVELAGERNSGGELALALLAIGLVGIIALIFAFGRLGGF
jgi:hypothetical protein